MARFLPVLTTVAAAALAFYALPALAATPYDGQWIIDAPPAGGAIGAEGQYTCPGAAHALLGQGRSGHRRSPSHGHRHDRIRQVVQLRSRDRAPCRATATSR